MTIRSIARSLSLKNKAKLDGEALESRRLLTATIGSSEPSYGVQISTMDDDHVHLDGIEGIVTSLQNGVETQALDLNAPLPITEYVTIQPIIVANDDGSNSSEYFGTVSQQAALHQMIDDIWEQAGIDIVWLEPNYWNDTFANIGNNPSGTRSTSDLGTIRSQGDAAGLGNTDPLVLDMYFVEISPGFGNLSENHANGLAFVGSNGITVHIGDNLLGWTGGQEVIARVVAHEIGHNLNLGHVSESGNLMDNGAKLNSSQINAALNISFSIPVPANNNPTVANPISDVAVDENASDTTIDLSNVFADVEDVTFSFAASSNNTGLTNVVINGTDLVLSYVNDQHGSATIVVTATDSGGLQVSDDFDVVVNEVTGPLSITGVFSGESASGLRISAVDATGTTYNTLTDTSGSYSLPVPVGDYFVTASGSSLQFPVVVANVNVGASSVVVNLSESGVPNGQDLAGETVNGQFWVGQSTGTSLATKYYGARNSVLTYQQLGTADMNGDGLDDIVARASNGQLVVSIAMANSSFRSNAWGVFSTATTWSEIHVGDFNGDGFNDVLGRADSDGSFWLAASTGNSFATSYWGRFSTSVTWADMQTGDFNGDGNADIVARAHDGTWWAAISNGSNKFNNSYWARWSTGVTWTDVNVGDFNGDGLDDIAGRANNAYWWVNRSSGSNYFLAEYWGVWGAAATWEDVMVADFDGDGDDDIAGRANGQWWIAKSNGTALANEYWASWSTAVTWSDVSIIDLNGDGRSDIVGRTQQGEWWSLRATGTGFQGAYVATWSAGLNLQAVTVGNFI